MQIFSAFLGAKIRGPVEACAYGALTTHSYRGLKVLKVQKQKRGWMGDIKGRCGDFELKLPLLLAIEFHARLIFYLSFYLSTYASQT